MEKKDVKNCWEFWSCEVRIKEKCPAYTSNSGNECWWVAGSYHTSICTKLGKEFAHCYECPWFKQHNPTFDNNNSQ